MKFVVDRNNRGYIPFDNYGMPGTVWRLFGEGMKPLLDVLNERPEG